MQETLSVPFTPNEHSREIINYIDPEQLNALPNSFKTTQDFVYFKIKFRKHLLTLWTEIKAMTCKVLLDTLDKQR